MFGTNLIANTVKESLTTILDPGNVGKGDGSSKSSVNKNVKKVKKTKGKKSKGVKKKVINEFVSGDVASLIIKAFNMWYADTGYFLAMDPLDNNVVLDKVLITGKDFRSLLQELQKKWTIYKYGYNIFIDGNIIFIINKSAPNLIDLRNDFTYKFVVTQDYPDPMGNHVTIIDENTNEITWSLDKSAVEYAGHFLDHTPINTITVSKSTGQIIADAINTGLFQIINYVDDVAKVNNDNSGSDKGVGSLVAGLTNSISTSTSSAKEGLGKVVNDAGVAQQLIQERKEGIYSLVKINLGNSFFKFTVGDKIEIRHLNDQTKVWKGKVKSWAAQQISDNRRAMYIMAVGNEYPEESSGNPLAKLDLFSDNLIPKLDMSNLSKLQQITNSALNVAKNGTNFAEQFSKDIEKVGKRAVEHLAVGALADMIAAGAEVAGNIVDKTIGKKLFNDIVNYSTAALNHPTIGPILKRGGTWVANKLSLTISELWDIMNNRHNVVIKESTLTLPPPPTNVEKEAIQNHIDTMALEYYILNTGLDDKIMNRLKYSLEMKTDPFKSLFNEWNKGNGKEEDISLFVDLIWTNMEEGKKIKRFKNYPNIDSFMDKLYRTFNDNLTELEEREEINNHVFTDIDFDAQEDKNQVIEDTSVLFNDNFGKYVETLKTKEEEKEKKEKEMKNKKEKDKIIDKEINNVIRDANINTMGGINT